MKQAGGFRGQFGLPADDDPKQNAASSMAALDRVASSAIKMITAAGIGGTTAAQSLPTDRPTKRASRPTYPEHRRRRRPKSKAKEHAAVEARTPTFFPIVVSDLPT